MFPVVADVVISSLLSWMMTNLAASVEKRARDKTANLIECEYSEHFNVFCDLVLNDVTDEN